MKPPKNTKHLLFGGTFMLANKLQFVGEKMVDGLSLKQWFLLLNILDLPSEPPPTINQIARAMDSTRQNIAKMLEIMEREGLVTLEQNKSDRRSRNVRVTAFGLTRMKQTTDNAQEFLYRLYDGITSEECDAAAMVMKKMVYNLQKMQEELQ